MRVAALTLAATLLAACGAGDDGPAGDEGSAEAQPSPQPPADVSGEPNGSGGLVVRLPGLPIGGDTVAFSATRPLGCVEVAAAGDGVPAGSTVIIEAFDVPPGFVAAGVACKGLDACLGGPGLASDGSCSLPLRWDGETVPAGTAELGVLAASLDCPSQDTCNQAVADISATGAGTVDLAVEVDR